MNVPRRCKNFHKAMFKRYNRNLTVQCACITHNVTNTTDYTRVCKNKTKQNLTEQSFKLDFAFSEIFSLWTLMLVAEMEIQMFVITFLMVVQTVFHLFQTLCYFENFYFLRKLFQFNVHNVD